MESGLHQIVLCGEVRTEGWELAGLDLDLFHNFQEIVGAGSRSW